MTCRRLPVAARGLVPASRPGAGLFVPKYETHMDPLQVDTSALADAVDDFIDVVIHCKYTAPRACFDASRLARGLRPLPHFGPDERDHNRDSIRVMFTALRRVERLLNPGTLRYSHADCVARIVAYLDRDDLAEPVRRAISAVALAVDTVRNWWKVDEWRNTSKDTDARVDRRNAEHGTPKPLPRGFLNAIGDAACRLNGRTPPPRQELQPATEVDEACRAAKLVVVQCFSMADLWGRSPDSRPGHMLLALADDLQEARQRIPVASEFWRPACAGRLFQTAGVTGATAHQASLALAEHYLAAVGRAGRESRFSTWKGVMFDVPRELAWHERAFSEVTRWLKATHPIDVKRWTDELDVEAANLARARPSQTAPADEQAIARTTTSPPLQPAENLIGTDVIETGSAPTPSKTLKPSPPAGRLGPLRKKQWMRVFNCKDTAARTRLKNAHDRGQAHCENRMNWFVDRDELSPAEQDRYAALLKVITDAAVVKEERHLARESGRKSAAPPDAA